LNVSAAQTVGAALASVTSALIGSLFGALGTILGAAISSLVYTFGAAFYELSIKRGSERLRVARANAPAVRRVPTTPTGSARSGASARPDPRGSPNRASPAPPPPGRPASSASPAGPPRPAPGRQQHYGAPGPRPQGGSSQNSDARAAASGAHARVMRPIDPNVLHRSGQLHMPPTPGPARVSGPDPADPTVPTPPDLAGPTEVLAAPPAGSRPWYRALGRKRLVLLAAATAGLFVTCLLIVTGIEAATPLSGHGRGTSVGRLLGHHQPGGNQPATGPGAPTTTSPGQTTNPEPTGEQQLTPTEATPTPIVTPTPAPGTGEQQPDEQHTPATTGAGPTGTENAPPTGGGAPTGG
jgi:hypothetical protein